MGRWITNVNDAKKECSSKQWCHSFFDRSRMNPGKGTQFVSCATHTCPTPPCPGAATILHGIGTLYIKNDYGGN